jgi:hypothetical protein
MHPSEYVRARASTSELADRYQVCEPLRAMGSLGASSDRELICVGPTGGSRDCRAKFSGSLSI